MIKALILSVIVATTVADDKCDYYGQKYEDGETWVSLKKGQHYITTANWVIKYIILVR